MRVIFQPENRLYVDDLKLWLLHFCLVNSLAIQSCHNFSRLIIRVIFEVDLQPPSVAVKTLMSLVLKLGETVRDLHLFSTLASLRSYFLE